MGKVINRSKIQGLASLATQLFLDLKDIGMTQVMPASPQAFTPTGGNGKFVMDSSADLNPLNSTQPWRILVELATATGSSGGEELKVAIANPQQISNTGATSTFPGADDTNGARVMGQLGKAWAPNPTRIGLGDRFISRRITNMTFDSGATISYVMTATSRGVGLFIWDEASDAAPKHSWFVVQSPVDKDTGAPLLTDNSPIFCVYCCDASEPQKFIVNESDAFRPTASKSAAVDSVNSSAILNGGDQVAIAKGNKYLITVPNRLNTDRYAYTEELDMFAYTSADVIGPDSEIALKMYNESEDRVYRAMQSNGPDNTKMRIMMLVEGGGISAV